MSPMMTAGLGLKPQHFDAAEACAARGMWFEVHAENYMVEGGPRLAWLERIRASHPLSLHGVALSLAADAPPEPRHLARFAALVDRLQPALVSEHLAWSVWRGAYRPDLLPVPRTTAVLRRVVDNIARVQERVKRQIALENPSHYLAFDTHEYGEVEFLVEIARRTGCALLLDVNNVHVSANNLGFDAATVIDAVPAALVAEIHLAGHHPDPKFGAALLIDSHDAPVAAPVWALYQRLLARIGPRPTLIERDEDVPAFESLLEERERAHALLTDRVMEAA
ncbi:MAG: MNIO family bufferin maturase [Burkholderiaceae bacterium]